MQFFEICQIKYLNKVVKQDHQAIKGVVNPMMRFKVFHSAEATLAGIELHHMLKKVSTVKRLICRSSNNFMHLRPDCAQGNFNRGKINSRN